MTKKMGIRWHLREVMAGRGLFMTSQLRPLLAERGVELSREQVYRLVTSQPERINVYTLAALCDILECQVGELIEPVTEASPKAKKAAGAGTESKGVRAGLRPTRARIAKPAPPER